jgi:membrane-associated phospholipid phosphatase
LVPGWERIGQAAKNAALATETWAPAAGALALQIGHADRNVQTWAAKHTPVFGSQRNADQVSDNLKHASGALWLVSGLATPSGDDGGDDGEGWFAHKALGLGIQAAAGGLLRSTVGILKDTTARTRPNGLGQTSFPSDHASNASYYATAASKNIGHLGWSENTLSITRFGLGTMTAATAWARVEANQHYPSDVLAGIALGHFFGAFFTDAFLGIDDPDQVAVLFEPSREGFAMTVRFGL